MNPLVSILIPAYNAEPWIAEALQSAFAQTWKRTEVIVVDDGSTDNTLSVAQRFAGSSVKVIHQQNGGASASRNRALRESRGDFIQYLDADDLLAPDKIELQLQLAQTAVADAVITGEWARFYKSPQEAVFARHALWADMPPVEWLVQAWNDHSMMHPAAWLVPRSVAERAGYWNEKLSLDDDGEYFCRVVLASRSVKFCSGARSYYRSGLQKSLSGLRSDAAWASALLALELKAEHLLAREDSSRTQSACATTFQRFIYEAYPSVPALRRKAAASVQKLGGTRVKPFGGPVFHLLSSIAGWKLVKRLQNFTHRHGYRKVAIGRRASGA